MSAASSPFALLGCCKLRRFACPARCHIPSNPLSPPCQPNQDVRSGPILVPMIPAFNAPLVSRCNLRPGLSTYSYFRESVLHAPGYLEHRVLLRTHNKPTTPGLPPASCTFARPRYYSGLTTGQATTAGPGVELVSCCSCPKHISHLLYFMHHLPAYLYIPFSCRPATTSNDCLLLCLVTHVHKAAWPLNQTIEITCCLPLTI